MEKYEKDQKISETEQPGAHLPPYTRDDGGVLDGSDDRSQKPLSFWTRMGCTLESFQRRPALANKHNQLNQTLKSRHLHMIAIGGSIGAGLFVGSGSALGKAGPGGLLLDFGIIGVMMFNVVYALGELAIMYPISGGFYTYSTRFIDPSWGFAMGWNYVFQWAIVLPLELTVAAITIEYWQLKINVGIWITVFIVLIVLINVFGVLGYGEEEFWSSVLKLAAIVIFLIIGMVCVLGGGPSDGKYTEYWGARHFYNPGAFANGFKGVCAVFVTAAFAFSGTELVGLAAAESKTPLKSLPAAIKQVFWRITLFYILSLLFVSLLVPYNDKRLLGSGYIDVKASPFVIVAKDAGLIGFDSFMNVVILVSVISIGNSGVYGGSRTLTALSEQGYAPKIFSYIDKAGRPLVSTIAIISCSALAYINISASGPVIFDWLLALSGLAALFTWGSICLAHIRFRMAWKYHGHTEDELPFKAAFGVAGSWLGLTLIILVLIAQFYTAVWPLGNNGKVGTAEGFFKSYLAAPVVLFFWACGYFWKRTGWLRLAQIDVDSGRREIDWDAHNLVMEKRRNASLPMRIIYFLF
ncbi:Amino-acid permease inda1 [Myotisia sp. PD_48]|nr:Amino-acid permease inda1 [Myotisia sp. PD_48]